MNEEIKKLSKEISLLIAAGEVIENPLSIIKELVENSIDANAKKIIIEIKNGGKSFISITDDGIGIEESQLELAFERYATSKLKSKEGIYSIESLGFRGEALSSIASVSKVKCTSRTRESNNAKEIEILYGKVISSNKSAANYGTKLIIENLFENTPARLKFLSTERIENSKIINFIHSIALSHSNISFELIIDKKRKISTYGSNDMIQILSEVYKIKQNDLISVKSDHNENIIEGYIAVPSKNFGNRSRMNIFINNRVIKNSKLFYTIENAYRPFVINKKFPVVSLNIKIPTNRVDVNVHPQKHEIKLMDEDSILSFIYNSISKKLNEEVPPNSLEISNKNTHEITQFEKIDFVQETLFEQNENIPLKKALPILRYIGQIKNTFILCEGPDGLYIIDQHAAHERILFEKYNSHNISNDFQILNVPKYVDLGVIVNSIITDKIDKFIELGWDIEESATGEIIVRNIPFVGLYKTRETDVAKLLELMSKDFNKKNSDTSKEIICKRLACHSAVRAGDSLTKDESLILIKDLEETNIPWDPHGRPAVVKLEFEKISNQFGR